MKKHLSEFLGTFGLVFAGTGAIVINDVTGGSVTHVGVALTFGLVVLAMIYTFGDISGAHLNPAVTLAAAVERDIEWADVPGYVSAQLVGALLGVAAAHFMFGEPILVISQHARSGGAQIFSEFVATFGLLSVIWGCSRARSDAVPFAVGAYITGAYWFTASTSFANPTVTLGRSLTNTFSGIRPIDAPGFIAAQLVGALTATALWSWLLPAKVSEDVLVTKAERRIVHAK